MLWLFIKVMFVRTDFKSSLWQAHCTEAKTSTSSLLLEKN